jgi:hypothetical protein
LTSLIVNNPDFWHKKKRGMRKLKHWRKAYPDILMPSTVIWREVDVVVYKKHGPNNSEFRAAQRGKPWFDVDCDPDFTIVGEDPKYSDWKEVDEPESRIQSNENSEHEEESSEDAGEEKNSGEGKVAGRPKKTITLYTHTRPMTAKIQLDDENSTVINNPDYWAGKKNRKGLKKLKNMNYYEHPGGPTYREVDMRIYNRLKKGGKKVTGTSQSVSFDYAQKDIRYFHPDQPTD